MTSLITLNQHKKSNASLKSETMGKLIMLINSRLLISSLPGSALRTRVDSLGKPRDVNKRSQSHVSKATNLVFSICMPNLFLILTTTIRYCKDKPKALKRDSIYNIDNVVLEKGFQAFIYIYFKSFDIHICSSRSCSCNAFCINRLK